MVCSVAYISSDSKDIVSKKCLQQHEEGDDRSKAFHDSSYHFATDPNNPEGDCLSHQVYSTSSAGYLGSCIFGCSGQGVTLSTGGVELDLKTGMTVPAPGKQAEDWFYRDLKDASEPVRQLVNLARYALADTAKDPLDENFDPRAIRVLMLENELRKKARDMSKNDRLSYGLWQEYRKKLTKTITRSTHFRSIRSFIQRSREAGVDKYWNRPNAQGRLELQLSIGGVMPEEVNGTTIKFSSPPGDVHYPDPTVFAAKRARLRDDPISVTLECSDLDAAESRKNWKIRFTAAETVPGFERPLWNELALPGGSPTFMTIAETGDGGEEKSGAESDGTMQEE